MKQALTETLAYFDANEQAFRMSDLKTYVDAARLVERLLPGECENCGGTGIAGVHRHIKQSTGEHLGDQDVPCGFCDNGQVWDEGIVEAVAKAIYESLRSGSTTWDATGEEAKGIWRAYAHAVLSAIAELLTEKVET